MKYTINKTNFFINSMEDVCHLFGSGAISYEDFTSNRKGLKILNVFLKEYGIAIPSPLTKEWYNGFCISCAEIADKEEESSIKPIDESKIERCAKYAISNINSLKEEMSQHIDKISGLSASDIEEYLSSKSESIYKSIMGKIKAHSDKIGEAAEMFPQMKERHEYTKEIVSDLESMTEGADETSSSKIKTLAKAVMRWIVVMFIKAAAIILKLAIVVAVGAIKIGGVVINTAFNIGNIIKDEVVMPGYRKGKASASMVKEVVQEKKAAKKAKKEWSEALKASVDNLI